MTSLKSYIASNSEKNNTPETSPLKFEPCASFSSSSSSSSPPSPSSSSAVVVREQTPKNADSSRNELQPMLKTSYQRVSDPRRSPMCFRTAKWNPVFAAFCVCAGILVSVGVYLLTVRNSKMVSITSSSVDCSAPTLALCKEDYFYVVCQSSCARFSGTSVGNTDSSGKKTKVSDSFAHMPSAGGQEPVVVEVYYEADCPDSKTFFGGQLAVLLDKLGKNFTSRVDLRLYPYGKARTTNDGDIHCQHGPHECEGNTVMACALFLYRSDWLKLVRFIVCFMKNLGAGNAEERALYCDKDITKQVSSCVEPNALGRKLHGEMGRHTKDTFGHDLMYIPWIIVNDDAGAGSSRAAEFGLLKFLCEQHDLCVY